MRHQRNTQTTTPTPQNFTGDFCSILLGRIDIIFMFSSCVTQNSDTSLYLKKTKQPDI